ncbi:MAG: hypothetical protein HJJLKODD_00861 [Phycisphaerae bacterium]|nr:hypothetical protein [Phycisphaerae bacterium]
MLLLTLTCWIGLTLSAPAQEPAPSTQPAATETPATDNPLHPRLLMSTTLGDITLELDAEKAPITVLNFIDYAEAGYYEGTIFHRIVKGFMIQGGGMTPEMEEKTGQRDPITLEDDNGLTHLPFTIAMARTGDPNSATAQFFINIVDNSNRWRGGRGYAVFGKVVEGLDTVEKIINTPLAMHPKYRTREGAVTPETPVVINSVKLIGTFDREKVHAQVEAKRTAAQAAKQQTIQAWQEQHKDTISKIETETGKKFTTTASGLMYMVLQDAEGATPTRNDIVRIHYTGWLESGQKFDSSYDRGTEPLSHPSQGFIPGWNEALLLMKVGQKCKLLIPSDLGYGEEGTGNVIPPGATLIFDVELMGVEPGGPTR